jgi:hypothetical protein
MFTAAGLDLESNNRYVIEHILAKQTMRSKMGVKFINRYQKFGERDGKR